MRGIVSLEKITGRLINVCNKLLYGKALCSSDDFYYLFIFKLSRSEKQNMLNN